MTTLYITRWVLTRGIIVGRGEPKKMSTRQRRDLYQVTLASYRERLLMTIGHDAWLTLKEAQDHATYQFQQHKKACQEALKAAEEALVLLHEGKLITHQDPQRIRDLYAFGRPLLPQPGRVRRIDPSLSRA